MELYNNIASWIGWPTVVAILILSISVIIWLSNKHVSLLKQQNEFIEKQLTDCKQQAPDALANRLAERHKLLTQEIETLYDDNKKNEHIIKQLETQLTKTTAEAKELSTQLQAIQDNLDDLVLPRDGKVKEEICHDIMKTYENHSAIFIPVNMEIMDQSELESIKTTVPYKLKVDFPGMFKMYLIILGNDGQEIGFVENPYLGYYNKDYYVSLLSTLGPSLLPHSDTDPNNHNYQAFIIQDSEFFMVSPFDESVFYIKVPLTAMG